MAPENYLHNKDNIPQELNEEVAKVKKYMKENK